MSCLIQEYIKRVVQGYLEDSDSYMYIICLPLVVWLMQVSLFSVLNERSWLSDNEACLDLVLIQVLQKREKSYSCIAIL